MAKVRLLCLDVIGGTGFKKVECEELQDFYDALKCNCFDITTRNVGGKIFDIFVDDVGLFAENPIPSAFDSNLKPALVGNLVFANHDSEGNTVSLSDEDISHIENLGFTAIDYDADPIRVWTAIQKVDYRV